MNVKVLIGLGILVTVVGGFFLLDSPKKSAEDVVSQSSPINPPALTLKSTEKNTKVKFTERVLPSRSIKTSKNHEEVQDFVVPSSKDFVKPQNVSANLKDNKGPWVSALSGSESQKNFLNKKQREKCTTEDCAYKKGEPIQLVGVKVETSQGRAAKEDWIDGDLEVGNGAKDPVLFVD